MSGNQKVTIMNDFKKKSDCPITVTLEFIGGRWKTVILFVLSNKTYRFGEVAARIPSISRKVLTQQLKELVEDGLVRREQFNEIPPRVEYTITDFGRSLNDVLKQMEEWGTKNGLESEKFKP